MLVAISVYVDPIPEIINRTIKDRHYDVARKLISILEERTKQRIGVCTRTIHRRSRNQLRRIVNEYVEKGEITAQGSSDILNIFGDRLERIVEVLVLEPVDQDDKQRLMTQVGQMYVTLRQRASLVTSQTTESIGEKKAIPTASPPYRNIKANIETDRLRRSRSQLYDFVENFPNLGDCEILAEAAALWESYSSEMPTELYLASTDARHFSPRRFDDGVVSDQVTKQIEETFNVKCHWPEVIAERFQ